MTPAEHIVRRCQDPELGLSAHFGGVLDQPARKMSLAELSELSLHLDYLFRGEPDPVVRRRYNNTIDFLREVAALKERERARDRVTDLAKIARRTGRETCECGEAHVEGGPYYVTVKDGPRVGLLSGPYRTHAEALAKVTPVRERAVELDGKAHFYSFGTALLPPGTTQKGRLD